MATEGKSEEEQVHPDLAPLYYEYGVALIGVCREADGASGDGGDDGNSTAEREEPGPCAKRRRLEAKAQEADGEDEVAGDREADDEEAEENEDEEEDEEEEDEGEEEDDDDDAAIAWQLVDQARCIFLEAGRKQDVAKCAEQLAGLNVDQGRWADAIVEFSTCVEYYEDQGAALDLEDEVRFLSCVASLSAAYGEHALASPGADVEIEGEGGAMSSVADAADVAARAASYATMAEERTNALLERLARDGTDVDAKRKRDLVALAVEVQVAKDRAAEAATAAAAPA